jgi:hypothetical protein
MAGENHANGSPEQKPRPAIKVTDRRHFTATGERREGIPEEAPEDPPQPQAAPAETAGSEARARFERRDLKEPEGVDFTMLVNAMAQPALWFLGEVSDPATGQRMVNLEQARLQIDMLDLLRVKCRGNLTLEEQDLLERVLYRLRMLYVSKAERVG